NLYTSYLHLSLTNSFNYPLAINGLQDYILSILKAKGSFSVFNKGIKRKGLLKRSLL
ncbi:hypothetical protein B0T21DRAFT_297935, partial [Apiosordaria backusii]